MTKLKGDFRRDKFLLRMLASIFALQGAIFIFGIFACTQMGGIAKCPDLGRRYDQTFGVMIATTLALLTGSQLGKAATGSPDTKKSPTPIPPKEGK